MEKRRPGTDCGGGFSLPLGCAFIRDRARCEWRQSWDFLGVCYLAAARKEKARERTVETAFLYRLGVR